MTAFLWTMIGLNGLVAISNLIDVYIGPKNIGRLTGFLIALSVCGWAGYLLIRG